MDKLKKKTIENGDHVIGVFLDFSKAFDTVDHSIISYKITSLWNPRICSGLVWELFVKPSAICYI